MIIGDKTYEGIVLLLIMLISIVVSEAKQDDIYIIFYTSDEGKTGHVGIAVDNYKLFSLECTEEINTSKYDTVKTNTLTYFDLWGPEDINWSEHDDNLVAHYYRLPISSSEEVLNEHYFLSKGLPHRYNYPCDAMVRIPTCPSQDFRLKEIAEQIKDENPFFNTREYNCVDYVIRCIEELFTTDFTSKEFIPFAWSSTPNSFYKELVEKLDVEIIRDPGEKVLFSFFYERIIKSH